MTVFRITPIDRENFDWQCSKYCGEALVRAENEAKARALLSRTFGLLDPIGEGSCLSPWTSETHTRCAIEEISPGDGEPKILFPKTE